MSFDNLIYDILEKYKDEIREKIIEDIIDDLIQLVIQVGKFDLSDEAIDDIHEKVIILIKKDKS